MYAIIKSELFYYKNILIVVSTFIISLNTVFILYGGDSIEKAVPALRVSCFAFTIILFVYRIITLAKENRDKIFASLPIDRKDAGLARVVFVPLFWAFSILLFFISNIIVQNSVFISGIVSEVISITGIVLILNALAIIFLDLINFGYTKKQKIVVQSAGILFGIITYAIFILIIPLSDSFESASLQNMKSNIQGTYQSILSGIFLLGTGILLSALSAGIFANRKTYLNQ